MMTRSQQGAIAAGIAIGIAFLLIRVSSASSMGDYILAAGLTLIELAVVLYLERRAKQLDVETEAWKAQARSYQQLRELAQAADVEMQRRQSRVDEIDGKIDSHIEKLSQDRALSDLATLERAALNGIQAGYSAGNAANRGKPREAA
jgi:hypothetical protein